MHVKGTAVASIPSFIKSNYPDRYDEWFESLSTESQEIFQSVLLATNWYPLKEAFIDPTQIICNMFYDGNDRGAWESGVFSAKESLTGVYKMFVKAGTPQFLLKRASTIFTSFYKPSMIEVKEASSNHAVLHISEFPMPSSLVEGRIGGWIEQALIICGCNNPAIKITASLTKGNPVTEFSCSW